jgi:uncharacterized heparinase superfamily protein
MGQIVGRARFRMARPTVNSNPAPSVAPLATGAWRAGATHTTQFVAPNHLIALSRDIRLDVEGWDAPTMDKLLRYNLHYFDALASPLETRASKSELAMLMRRWVAENPPARGTGWEPYPTSLRIVNWIKWAFEGNELPAECVQSLAVQARWLTRRLERHILGNHLFANAKALMFVGTFFADAEAEGWRMLGARILDAELPEQILPDGGQFERSTMYHALAVEDVLDLCNLAEAAGVRAGSALGHVGASCRERVASMRRWLDVMSHPDGEIAFFNDAAFGIAPSPTELDRYAERLGCPHTAPVPLGLTWLESSGYARLSTETAVVLVDAAPVGPDYLPGHAHADTLSFELSIFGERVIVNSGTSQYGNDAERLRQRGTLAHNTVVLDDTDSSEVWSGFRVGRRARPLAVHAAESVLAFEASHDGYQRKPGNPLHQRRWALEECALVVTDVITGPINRAEARLHLHPAVEPVGQVSHGADSLALRLASGRIIALRVTGASLRIEEATWHPRFGERIASRCVVASLRGSTLITRLDWCEVV